jgi:hypothetical protein
MVFDVYNEARVDSQEGNAEVAQTRRGNNDSHNHKYFVAEESRSRLLTNGFPVNCWD